MQKLDKFNSLPARPEHIKKVVAVLKSGRVRSAADIALTTGLSRTQVLCVLDPMVKRGVVIKEKSSLSFYMRPDQ